MADKHLVKQALAMMQRDFHAKTWQACWAVVVEEQPSRRCGERTGHDAQCRLHRPDTGPLPTVRERLAGLLLIEVSGGKSARDGKKPERFRSECA